MSGCYRRPTQLLDDLTLRFDDAILAVSDDVRAALPRRHRRCTTTVAQGVEVDAIAERAAERDAARAELGAGSDELLVGTVATSG